MAHRFLKLSLVCMAIIANTDLKAQQAPVLWYDSPAEYWEEALPLGNGRLGAMVLREYQQRAVNNANKKFEERQFASIILPTGAGKSFVAMTELLEHKKLQIVV